MSILPSPDHNRLTRCHYRLYPPPPSPSCNVSMVLLLYRISTSYHYHHMWTLRYDDMRSHSYPYDLIKWLIWPFRAQRSWSREKASNYFILYPHSARRCHVERPSIIITGYNTTNVLVQHKQDNCRSGTGRWMETIPNGHVPILNTDNLNS